jgi:hypothetical protein
VVLAPAAYVVTMTLTTSLLILRSSWLYLFSLLFGAWYQRGRN